MFLPFVNANFGLKKSLQ